MRISGLVLARDSWQNANALFAHNPLAHESAQSLWLRSLLMIVLYLSAGRVAPHRCLPLLQRLGSATASSQGLPLAMGTAQRRLASLQSPIASYSYQAARVTPCRSAWLSRHASMSGPSTFGSIGLARFSTALSGSTLPSHTLAPSHTQQRQAETLHTSPYTVHHFSIMLKWMNT